MAAFLARAASFFAQAVSFHLLSISPSPQRQPSTRTCLVRLSNGITLVSTLDGDDKVGEVEVVQLVVTEQAHDSRASAVFSRQWRGHRRAPTKSATYKASHSLAIDDVDDRAELAEISSVTHVGHTTNFNETSKHLHPPLERQFGIHLNPLPSRL